MSADASGSVGFALVAQEFSLYGEGVYLLAAVARGLSARVVVTLALAAACARAPSAPPARSPLTAPHMREPGLPSGWFWDPESAAPHGGQPRKPVELPVADGAIARLDGAARLWSELTEDERERVRRDGVLVVDAPDAPKSMGAFYLGLRDRRIPQVITVDALFALVHVALVRALARVEDDDLGPSIQAFTDRLAARLAAEEDGLLPNLVEGHHLARTVVAVARVLEGRDVEDELRRPALEEKKLIEAHAGVALSPVLGFKLDYARFAAPNAARPAAYRALTWLTAAPFVLAARGEIAGAPVNVGQARTNARAAMLLARLCDRERDAETHARYVHITKLLGFVWGPPDDLTLDDVDDLGGPAGIDLRTPETMANVVAVDRLRRGALAGRKPSLFDGSGIADRAGLGIRIFGAHAPPDSVALAASGRIPSTLDVATWLASPPPNGSAVHASVYGSLSDALATWASTASSAPSTADDRRKVESMLSAWTLLRHLGPALARARPSPALAEPRPTTPVTVPLFVEPAPAVIARLGATARQIRRGLEALGGLDASTSALLVEVEDILHVALEGSERLLTADEASTLPVRIAKVEDEGDPGPVVATVYKDLARRRHLASATGRIERALILLRVEDAPVLAVGAHVAHHEIVEDTGPAPLTDAAWRERIAGAGRAEWTSAFRAK